MGLSSQCVCLFPGSPELWHQSRVGHVSDGSIVSVCVFISRLSRTLAPGHVSDGSVVSCVFTGSSEHVQHVGSPVTCGHVSDGSVVSSVCLEALQNFGTHTETIDPSDTCPGHDWCQSSGEPGNKHTLRRQTHQIHVQHVTGAKVLESLEINTHIETTDPSDTCPTRDWCQSSAEPGNKHTH